MNVMQVSFTMWQLLNKHTNMTAHLPTERTFSTQIFDILIKIIIFQAWQFILRDFLASLILLHSLLLKQFSVIWFDGPFTICVHSIHVQFFCVIRRQWVSMLCTCFACATIRNLRHSFVRSNFPNFLPRTGKLQTVIKYWRKHYLLQRQNIYKSKRI